MFRILLGFLFFAIVSLSANDIKSEKHIPNKIILEPIKQIQKLNEEESLAMETFELEKVTKRLNELEAINKYVHYNKNGNKIYPLSNKIEGLKKRVEHLKMLIKQTK